MSEDESEKGFQKENNGLRPGEVAIDIFASPFVAVRPIGHCETPWTRREDCPRQGSLDGPDCRLVVHPGWAEALTGIAAYSRLEVLYWMNRARRDLVLQSPRGDGRTHGTFALRSPNRPNPIGSAIVQLVSVEGTELVVRGLDCLDPPFGC